MKPSIHELFAYWVIEKTQKGNPDAEYTEALKRIGAIYPPYPEWRRAHRREFKEYLRLKRVN